MNASSHARRNKFRSLGWAALAALAVAAVAWARARPVHVQTVRVEPGAVRREAAGAGSIESEARAQLAFTLMGRITALNVQEGATVRKGDILATLDAEEQNHKVALAHRSVELSTHGVARNDAEIQRAQAVLSASLVEQRRVSQLRASGAAPAADQDAVDERVARARADLLAAQAAQHQGKSGIGVAQETERLEREREAETRLISPVDGVVVKRLHEPGDVVSAGSTVLVVSSTQKVWASVWIDESVLHELAVGQPARVSTRGAPSESYRARVDRIGVETDRQTHEVLIDLELLERPHPLVFGQRVDGAILLEERMAKVRVPEGVCDLAASQCLAVRDGRVTALSVRAGLVGTDWVEAVEGLGAGELLVRPASDGAWPRVGRRVREEAP
jgi:HlyD family secretion protein